MYHRYVEQDLLPSEWNAWIATCEAPDVSTSSSSFSLYCVILLKMCLWVPKYWKCAWEQCSQFPHFQEVWWCRSSCTVYTNLSMAMAMLQMSCTHFLLLASSCCTNVMATYTTLRSSRDFCMLLSSQLVARVMLIGCPSLMTVWTTQCPWIAPAGCSRSPAGMWLCSSGLDWPQPRLTIQLGGKICGGRGEGGELLVDR